MGRLFGVLLLLAWVGCGEVTASPDGGSDAAGLLCTPNAKSCGTDNAVYQCNADGTDQTKVEDCPNGCSDGVCHPCTPGSTFCNAGDLATCGPNGSIASMTSCMGHGCQNAACNACTPGVPFCSGSNAVQCNADGTAGSSMSCGGVGCSNGLCNSCTANTTTCMGDSLVVCNASGTIASVTNCALGCSSAIAPPRCKNLVPSYGVPAPSGVDAFDLDVNANTTIDISNCNGSPNTVNVTIGMTTMSIVGAPQIAVVNQNPPICVLKYHNITVESGMALTIINSSSGGQVLALEAEGTIDVSGTIAFRNQAGGSSAGADATAAQASGGHRAAGPGGGGNARAGGSGGACTPSACGLLIIPGGAGGPAVTTITARLTPGSRGGSVFEAGTGAQEGFGGPGGGGLQLVALGSISISATGRIDLNGGGGTGKSGSLFGFPADLPAGGGGSGGTVVIEAPSVLVSAAGVIAGNGGGGAGGCYTCGIQRICSHSNGQPGQLSAARAAGGSCSPSGSGGSAANGVTNPSPAGQPSDSGGTVAGGGGGGGDGYILLHARDLAHIMLMTGSVVSPVPTPGAVGTN